MESVFEGAARIGTIIGLGPKEYHQELRQLDGANLVVESLRDFPLSLFEE